MLADRGGLTICELVALLNDISWREVSVRQIADLIQRIEEWSTRE